VNTLVKIISVILFFLLFSINIYSDTNQKKTLSIIEFKVNGIVPLKDAGIIVANEVLTAISKTGKYKLLERVILNKILEEQKLSAIGAVSQESAVQLGKLYGVQSFIVGTINGIGNRYILSARIIDTTTGEIKNAVQTTFKNINNISVEVEYLVKILLQFDKVPYNSKDNNNYNSKEIAFWPMYEGEGGFIHDKSGNGLDCIGNNIGWLGDKGVIFNGINSFVDCSSNEKFNFEKSISIIVYLKYSEINHNFVSIIEKTGVFSLLLEKKSGKIEFFINGLDSIQSKTKLIPDNWYMIAVVFTGEKLKLFINGMLSKQFSRKGLMRKSNSSLIIGDWSDKDGYRAYNGIISNIRLYSKPLNNNEIIQIYKKFLSK